MAPVRSLSVWTKKAESLETSKNLLYYRQLVGLKFDERRLASLEAESNKHYRGYLRAPGGHKGAPRGLFLMSVAAVGTAATYSLFLRFHEARSTKVVSSEFKFRGAPVNWGSWRLFAASTDDSAARKRLFDDFLSKSSLLSPLVHARFEGYRAKLAEFGTDPLTAYLELEAVSYERLGSLVQRLGELCRAPFAEALARYSSEIMGRPAEYYDDFYFFRSRVFKKYSKEAPTKEEPIACVVRTMKRMGLDASRIRVDDADRKGKSSSAFCSGINIPSDVRISYRRADPFDDLSPVFHEFGHGIHFSSIDPKASFSDRYGVANGVAEVFSIFFEGLIHEKAFLTSELGIREQAAEDILDRFRFGGLYFTAFYAANSTLKLRYWHDSQSFEGLDGLYSDLTEKYLGIRYPGAYWKLHHVMPDSILYSPSYLIAAIRARELRNELVGRFGERYWEEAGAGVYLLELMRRGQAVDLGFSKLDGAAYVKSLTAS